MDNSSFDLHFYVDRHGQCCVSTTLPDGRKSRAVTDAQLGEAARKLHEYLVFLGTQGDLKK